MVAQTKTAEPTVVNGINVDDLFALIEGVRKDAGKGRTGQGCSTLSIEARLEQSIEAAKCGGIAFLAERCSAAALQNVVGEGA